MSLIDNLPHKCTIRRRVRSQGSLGGSKDSYTDEQTGVACWEQALGASETLEYQKRGMSVSRKVYFASDPSVTERHQVLVTERNGTAVSSPAPLDVMSEPMPDVTAGFGLLWRVLVNESTGRDD